MITNFDEKLISYAINLSKKNLGLTAPNPCVGCVITKDNQIISSGVTAAGGRPHAEKIAIDKVENKEDLKGAVIYVTLEPCFHFGETSPCVDEIIKFKFKKVVISIQDSDKRVDGKSIKKLQEAGIEVVCGILEKQAKEINKAFFKRNLTKLPYITLKIASSLDGKIATKNFDSKWISNEQSRKFSHYLRSINDAILVGANTAKKDNPKLDCRLEGLEKFSPKKVIIAKNLDFDVDLEIFKKSETIILLPTNTKVKNSQLKNIKIIFCKEKNNQIDLRDALEKLAENGVNSLLVEGGKNIATQFIKENLIDELVIFRSSKIIGNDGIAAIGEMNFDKISEVINNFKRTETREFGEDLMEIYIKKI